MITFIHIICFLYSKRFSYIKYTLLYNIEGYCITVPFLILYIKIIDKWLVLSVL